MCRLSSVSPTTGTGECSYKSEGSVFPEEVEERFGERLQIHLEELRCRGISLADSRFDKAAR